jgi:hypothetical protein
VRNSELVAKIEQWLNDVSAALPRRRREREGLRETRTQIMMGVLSVERVGANLSRLTQSGSSNRSGPPAHIVARSR